MNHMEIAVRLADEGVPVCAIARAVSVPSERLREQLHAAQNDGRLITLPKEDWPIGFPRDQRALQLSRMVDVDRKAVMLVLQQAFGLTVTEAAVLMALIQNATVPKTRLGMSAKSCDVHVCRIRRRLRPFGIRVETIWGVGHRLAKDDRRKILDHLDQLEGAAA
jgi:hypothetical protein